MSELISKEDALNCFHDWIDRYGYEHTADEDTVYQKIAGLKSIENCADAISRKMAIDVMCEMMYHWFGGNPKDEIREIVRELKKLPSVQPDHNADVSKKVADADCISRRAAIDIFDDYNVSVENGELEAYSRDRKRLCGLPPAQPKIIYCKDCIWYELPSHRITENCVRWMKSNGVLLPIKPNDYCSYAERRTDG